jgi:hypothetical protein
VVAVGVGEAVVAVGVGDAVVGVGLELVDPPPAAPVSVRLSA